ncbi:MAG: trypsin-like peptidase domain-containing protein [Chloroflexota bacterium]
MQKNRWPPHINDETQPAPKLLLPRLKAIRARLTGLYTRYHIIFLLVIMSLVAFASVLIYDITRPPQQKLTQHDIDVAVERSLANAPPKPSFESQVYEKIRPSVVLIEVTASIDEEKTGGVGTGFIINDSGTILTSLHIVRGATLVQVTFADGTESPAFVMRALPENDLAVLRPLVIPDDIVPATLTSSDTLHIGDEVVAVGNPFGITNSLSSGVVSGLHRELASPYEGYTLTNLVQFDAAVNPGNSGGPLVNRDGEVVGIVTALMNPTDQNVFIGIGFAVPIETAVGGAGAPPV